MNLISAPGVYDIDIDRYHNTEICDAPSISGSGVVKLAPTNANPTPVPYKFWWDSTLNPDRERTDTVALRVGKAAHHLFLEGDAGFQAKFAIMPAELDLRSNAGKAFAAQAEGEGKILLRAKQYADILKMVAYMRRKPMARAAFSGGRIEPTLVWRDEITGVWLRCRPDQLPDDPVDMYEYKTARSAAQPAFSNAIKDYGYHIKAFHLMEGVRALGLGNPKTFTHFVQESDAPFLMAIHTLPREDLEYAEVQWRAGVDTFARCLATGIWPEYPDVAQETGLPRYAKLQLDQTDLTGTPPQQENDNEPSRFTAVQRFGA